MHIFGEEVRNFEELEKVVYDEMTGDDYWVDGETGRLPVIEDISDLHDLLEGWVEEEDYDEFNRILDEGEGSFKGIEFDDGDGMYRMSGGGFSSWSDYYRYRFG